MYDFHKIRNPENTEKNHSEFFHKDFSESNIKYISLIKRKGFQSKRKEKINGKSKTIQKKYVKKYTNSSLL
jgi:hypothetical protein